MVCHGIHNLGWRVHFVHRMSEEGTLSRAKIIEGQNKGVPVHAMMAYGLVKILKSTLEQAMMAQKGCRG